MVGRSNIARYFFLIVYRYLAQYLPCSGKSPLSKRIRLFCCKRIFKYCGYNVNVERKAFFGKGFDVVIGDNSGIGIECIVPSDIIIGDNVLMGPRVVMTGGGTTHEFSRTDIPIRLQGRKKNPSIIIGDDVWIGRQSIINQGRVIYKGTIIAAGSVVTRDFPEYSIIGGNPAKLIRKR
ncbi:MAG: acyltransferase [Bacteroidales bacterium]